MDIELNYEKWTSDKMRLLRLFVLTTPISLMSLVAQAANENIMLNVSVTVVAPPPCIINGEQDIVVDFGDGLIAMRIDGNQYLKTVNYSLECKNNISNALKIKVKGNSVSFDAKVLKTTKTDLGIAFQINGKAFPLNEWVNFTYPDQPLLQAVPVKRSGVMLTGGEFTAIAALMVDYQ